MKILTVLGILFYTAVLTIIGAAMVVFSLNVLQVQDITSLLILIQYSTHSRIIFGLSGLLLILLSFSFAQIILGRFQREKTIAFATASGEVTVALSAIEDLIKRMSGVIPEIKELRPDVIANKKGIMVDLRVILRSEANIPDLTSRLQEIIRQKIQEVLGVEEQIFIKIHVIKIASIDERDKRKKDSSTIEPTVPYSGYTRI